MKLSTFIVTLTVKPAYRDSSWILRLSGQLFLKNFHILHDRVLLHLYI